MMTVEIFWMYMRPINKTMKKKILLIHAEWLKQNGYKKEYKNCVKQIKRLDE